MKSFLKILYAIKKLIANAPKKEQYYLQIAVLVIDWL